MTSKLMTNGGVLVVGAGPAGLAAAIACVQSGLPTVLLSQSSRKIEIHLSPLQSVHPRVEPLLQQLEVLPALTKATVSRFNSIQIGSTAQHFSPYSKLDVYGYHVRRPVFDNALLDSARAVGVQVYTDARITEVEATAGSGIMVRTHRGQVFAARWVIDATGRTRTLARGLSAVIRPYSPPLIVRSGILRTENMIGITTHTQFKAWSDGWCWFTSAQENEVSWTALHSPLLGHHTSIDALVRQSIPGSVQTVDARWRLTRPLVIRGVLMVGEAAGRLDPAWGLGIVNALESGLMAARAIINSTAVPALASLYQAEYDSWFVTRYKESAAQLRNYYIQSGITVLNTPLLASD